ncbi:MAG: alpha/beta hydrolase [Pseudomonadota bacterium]
MPFVAVRGKQLEYLESGDGETPVILIHGAGSSALIWHQVQQHLADASLRTLALSLPGAGGSDASDNVDDYNSNAYAADIRGALDQLGIHRCVLVGHSLGVQNVISTLADQGEGLTVPALILMAGGACDFARPPVLGEQREAIIEGFRAGEDSRPETPTPEWTREHRGLPKDVRHRLWNDIRNNPFERAVGQRLGELRDRTGFLLKLEIPTLIVSGDSDTVVPLERTLKMYPNLSPDTRSMHILHGVGHYPNAEVPDTLARIIEGFVKEHVV